jgi:cephalosporin hydroxylase
MNPARDWLEDREKQIDAMANDAELHDRTRAWSQRAIDHRYTYNFTWLGRPVIQYPQDLIALQEIIWRTTPDLIIETGVAHGGTLVFIASMLELLGGSGRALGVEIDLRAHNRAALDEHPLRHRFDVIDGSSIAPDTIGRVHAAARGAQRVMVMLDANHTCEHVLAELEAYGPLVTPGCYMIVYDTDIDDLPPGSFPDRPWDIGDSPGAAVDRYLAAHDKFEIDARIAAQLQITCCSKGYLRRLPDSP